MQTPSSTGTNKSVEVGVKMRLPILSVAVVASMLSLKAAAEEYLLWMIDQSEVSDPVVFAVAQIKTDTGDPLTLMSVDNPSYQSECASADADGLSTDGMYFADVSQYAAGNKFLLELLSEDGLLAGTSKSVSYDELLGGGHIKSAVTDQATPFVGWQITAAPEPTSGLLVLLGFALMGLKRKCA